VLDDAELRRRLGDEARAAFASRFSLAAMVDRLEELFASLP